MNANKTLGENEVAVFSPQTMKVQIHNKACSVVAKAAGSRGRLVVVSDNDTLAECVEAQSLKVARCACAK